MRYLAVFVILAILGAAAQPLPAQSSSTATGVSNSMNPAISVNGLFLGQVSRDNPDHEFNNINVQEAETRFTSIVDPYWKAALTIAGHPAHSHASPHDAGEDNPDDQAVEETSADFIFHIEEAYIDGRALPAGFALRMGKFFLPFGKHVPLHTHQFPFVHSPLGVSAILGEHSLSESGAQITATIPVPWYADLSVYGVDGRAGIFDAANKNYVFGACTHHLWDIGQNSTLGLGGSALQGPDGRHPGESIQLNIYGADLTYKWVSAGQSKGPALNFTAELIVPDSEEKEGSPLGWYFFTQYRPHRNWWLGGAVSQAVDILGGHSDHEKDESETPLGEMWEYKFNLTFAPSEFSALRAEIVFSDDRAGDEDDLQFYLQWNFTIGSHPAHLY